MNRLTYQGATYVRTRPGVWYLEYTREGSYVEGHFRGASWISGHYRTGATCWKDISKTMRQRLESLHIGRISKPVNDKWLPLIKLIAREHIETNNPYLRELAENLESARQLWVEKLTNTP